MLNFGFQFQEQVNEVLLLCTTDSTVTVFLVCAVFSCTCPNNGMAANTWRLTSAQMLIFVNVIDYACFAYVGCANTMIESALKVDWEENSLPHQGVEPVLAVCCNGHLQF